MSAPAWYRCKACGSTTAYLVSWPRVYRPRPERGWTTAYQMLVPGSDLYCFVRCLPVGIDEYVAGAATVVGSPEPVQIGLGL